MADQLECAICRGTGDGDHPHDTCPACGGTGHPPSAASISSAWEANHERLRAAVVAAAAELANHTGFDHVAIPLEDGRVIAIGSKAVVRELLEMLP